MKRGLFALLPAALACGGTSPQTVQLRDAMAAGGVPAVAGVAFRMPSRRAAARLYELPGLADIDTRLDPGPGVERAVGFASDDDLLYALAGDRLLALDLRSGRVRTLDSNVAAAAMSPTGSVILAHQDRTLALASERRVNDAGALPPAGTIEALWRTAGGRTVAVIRGDSGRGLVMLDGGATPHRTPLPDGPFARTRWGDAVAIAGPDEIEVRELLREGTPLRIPLRRSVQAMAFSASGHRLYAATDLPDLQVYERYEGDALRAYTLPRAVQELRTDEFGRYVFGRSEGGIVVLDLAADTITTVAGAWSDDLPAAGPDGTVLLERGNDVVAVAPGDTTLRGALEGAAADRWLVAAWSPQRRSLAITQPEAQGAGTSAAGQEIFVQVSSTSNAQWADGLASDLRLAGMRATVLPPTDGDEMYRVVLGPYGNREEAEEIGRKLGMPYWIFQRDSAAAPGTMP